MPTRTTTREPRRAPAEQTEAPFKRLLVPLDGSPLAERALPFAQTLARTLGADLILVRAASPKLLQADQVEGQIKAGADAEAYFERLREAFRTDYGVEYSLPFGEPATEIANV